MSQFWHSHWAEDGFKPTRLQNWEVPRWHAEWPDRHCTTTRFDAHKNGRLFMSAKTSNSPWGNFKVCNALSELIFYSEKNLVRYQYYTREHGNCR